MWRSFRDVYHWVSQLNDVLPLVLQMVENKLFLNLWSKTGFSARQHVSEANGGWWHTDLYYSLVQTSAAEGAIRPQRCLSALWYTLRERERLAGGQDFDGDMLLKQPMAAGLVCVRARTRERETVHGEQERKACSLWGIDFYLRHDVTFPSVTPAVLSVRPRFSSPISLKCKWTFPHFFFFTFSNKERTQDRVEALFVCHHTMTFLLISGPAARQQFKC